MPLRMLAPNPFADATVASMMDAIAAAHPHRDAIVFAGERITFAQFRERTITLTRGLEALGIARGDKVAIWLPNRPGWYVMQHACARLGAIVVGLNPRYKAHELSYIMAQSDTKALFMTDHFGGTDYFETLHDVIPELRDAVPGEIDAARCPELRWVIVDADDPYPGCVPLRDVVDAGRDLTDTRAGGVQPAPDDVFTILYTSGTTSFPKGAMMTHRNCVPHGWNTGEVLRITPDDRVLHAVPANGTWGGLNIPLSTWSHGACLVLMDAYDPLRALALMERERCTVWNAVDAMARAMLDHPDLDRYDRSSLRTGAFAATGGGGHGLFDAVMKRIGIPALYQPYGMTEVNAMSLVHDLDEPADLRAVPGIHPPPGIEVRVVKPDTDTVCAPGEEGELQFRGMLVTPGYYKKPDETAAAFTADGWFKTGDLGVQDADGRVVFKGRLREVLRINHFMVSPGEIEAFLMSHPDVHQAFVVGVPNLATNEAAVAFIIAKPGASPTADGVRAFCRGKIASYKIPKVIRFVKDVPRTPGPHGDKVQRGKLREQALTDL